MRAIRVSETGGPEVLRLEELPDPQPGARDVVVRVRAAGVNPVDTYRRAGTHGRPPELPWIPGSDAAGVVERVGAAVTGVAPGDRVYTDHTAVRAYAELMLCRATQLHPLPARISFAGGASLGVPYATAYRALFQRGAARAGETLLVHGGTGGVGLAVIQLARAAGLTVIATGGTERGRDEARRQGADHVLDHRAPGYLDSVAELTGGKGVDLVIEMLANVNLGRDLGLLARGGRVVVVGSRGTAEIDSRDTMTRDADIRGLTLFNTPAEDLAAIHAALGRGLENGALSPVIDAELPLADAPLAHERVMAPGHQGKIVLIP
ncbi:MAG: NADPH:quinone reductase [Gemmatimonadetes bacterium]|nr:NADPH:quinone reductase [Gemmatimonadota bacterium]